MRGKTFIMWGHPFFFLSLGKPIFLFVKLQGPIQTPLDLAHNKATDEK